MEVGREDSGFHPMVGVSLVRGKERGDVVQPVSSTRGGWDDRVLDFSGLFWGVREGKEHAETDGLRHLEIYRK